MKKKIIDKKEIQRERMKSFFLDATKKIILAEGVENVTIRKVADIAGYSYATIYNYFVDLNELLWETKLLMIKDLIMIIDSKIDIKGYDSESIKKIFKTYISYYLENPNIFKFFYLYQLVKTEEKPSSIETQPDFDQMWRNTFKEFIDKGILSLKDLEVISKIFIYSMHGMLTLNFSYNMELTKDSIYRDLDLIVDFLLKK